MANRTSDINLLLIGAEPEMLELLESVLIDAGFEVTAAQNAQAIEANLADPTFDVVVCDEVHGVLDGLMIFDALLDIAPSPRSGFVLLSDAPDGARIATCLQRGMEEYVVKPFDVNELVARIQRVVVAARELRDAVATAAAQPAIEEDDADEELGEKVGFSGELEYLNLPDLLMNLHQNTRTGELRVDVEDGEYVFSFQRGELVRTIGPRGLKSRKAFFRSMRETAGAFRFVVLDQVTGRRSTSFENLANVILQAVQEADEFPLTRNRLPAEPSAVTLTAKVEDTALPENSAIQPLVEGLVTATTIDILIHACPKTDLEAASELEELMMAEVLVPVDGTAAAAS